ncbi:hypothetical protein B0T14DRAFT_501530, partial [Immersiella caudata]
MHHIDLASLVLAVVLSAASPSRFRQDRPTNGFDSAFFPFLSRGVIMTALGRLVQQRHRIPHGNADWHGATAVRP